MKKETEQWRVFVAIELPARVRKLLLEHIARLQNSVLEVRASWIREENLHLTLKFLGDTPVPRVALLSEAAQGAAGTVNQFELIIGGCGAFPPRGRPRVLWIGIEDRTGRLSQLHQALEDQCAALGFDREPRPFHPHLTIARLRQPEGSRRLAQLHEELGFRSESVVVSELSVIRSELYSEGSKHTVISRHELGSGHQPDC